MMNDNDDIRKTSVAPCVNQSNPNDKLVQQLLKKLDEGSETILNLRSLLTLKTVELNELVHQLELIDQVLMNVENGTEQIEIVLKDVLVSKNQQDKLLNAEATLDSAIKTACSLYSIDLYSVNNKQPSPIKTTSMLKKIAGILSELDIESTIDLYKNDDIKVLQKAYMDLDLAKTIATSIKTDFKHRSTLMKKKHTSVSSMDKIKQLGSSIRKQFAVYQSYTRNAPLIMYGKEDIITILDREDHIIASRKMVHTTPNNQQQQSTEKPARMHCSSTNTPKKRQSSASSSSPIKLRSKSTTNTTATTTTTAKSTLQMISRPTLTFMAKCKEKRAVNNGPGSTLRLRNMLAKRNPALKMINEQMMIGSTVC
ncbi:meiotic recombination [Mucor velutinosus]|uniref:Meiotic recombination n=1 Tax=Mucor velutinosus TaxID=708070 RepID=A0AAN7DKV3_9FUNG|nr:meiotic recombination [Mucor velutinosus]